MLATGPNGAGKTNLLESLHVATQGFSPRTRQDANLVRHGADGFEVRAEGSGESGEITLEVAFRPGEGKRVRINGAAAESLERVRSSAATLVFTPDRLAVVKAGPCRSPCVRGSCDRPAVPRPRGAGRRVRRGGRPAERRAAASLVRDLRRWTPWSHGTLGSSRRDRRWRPPGRTRLTTLQTPFCERAGELGLAGAASRVRPFAGHRGVARGAVRVRPRAGSHRRRPSPRRGASHRRRAGPAPARLPGRAAGGVARAVAGGSGVAGGAARRSPAAPARRRARPSSTESAAQRSCSESATAPRCSSRRPRAARCPAIPTSCSK